MPKVTTRPPHVKRGSAAAEYLPREDQVQPAQSKTRAKFFARLALDKRLAHGAVRLALVLWTHADNRGQCWPGQRSLRRELGASGNSLKPWVTSLAKAGYIRIKEITTKRGRATLYSFKWGVTETSNRGVTAFDGGVTGFEGGVTETSNETVLHRTVLHEPKGGPAVAKEIGLLSKDRERINRQIEDERKNPKPNYDLIAGLQEELEALNAPAIARGRARRAAKAKPRHAARPRNEADQPTPHERGKFGGVTEARWKELVKQVKEAVTV